MINTLICLFQVLPQLMAYNDQNQENTQNLQNLNIIKQINDTQTSILLALFHEELEEDQED